MAKPRTKSTAKKKAGTSSKKPRATRTASPAARKRPRRSEVKLAFEALSIEGGLLSPEWLALAAQLQASQQAPTDYRVPKGLNLRDEIGRYWRIAQAHHGDFTTGLAARAEPAALAERFILGLLRDCFGFSSLAPSVPLEIAGHSYPIGHAALGGRVPLVIAPAGSGLDTAFTTFGDEDRRRSAFGLAQEYLNAADSAMWGLCTDGVTLRLLRDNASLTRPAWIEADVGRMFTEERYADFAALWLIAHESRFGRADQPVAECALEAWRVAGLEKGTRAREFLRMGVEDAVVALGQGFLAHPDNGPLRAALESGQLTKDAYFQELLRLVYRLIFLLTVEERELLHPPASDEAAKALYAAGYGARRLRERSVKRSAHDRYSDLWEATKIVLRGLAVGEPRLALPALAGIFAKDQCPSLDAARLENRALLLAVFRLSWLRDDGGLARVNWRDMGPEELGSVYESLLELVPQVNQARRIFSFASGAETKGNARKSSGSYYTPDSLVQVLLDSALEPVVADTIARSPERTVDALLELSIVDPACGSGHFLLAAARRLASHVARLKASGTPSAHEYRQALRQVVGRCIYGVDLNPMAVELCKVSLWMEAVDPGCPLTFLDAHIRCGNSLLGTTPELMAGGIPDTAFEPIEGDDKKAAAALQKRNKAARAGQEGLEAGFSRAGEGGTVGLIHAVQALDAAPDSDLGSVEKKQLAWRALLDSEVYRRKQLAADAWCAAFVWKKESGPASDLAPTDDVWRGLATNPTKAPTALTVEVRRLAAEYQFFHWHLAFPQVLAEGGFDIVLGNPPWEKINFKDEEFFAQRSPDIANAANKAQRKKLLEQLRAQNSDLFAEYERTKSIHDGSSAYFRRSGCFPLTGVSRINLYSVFTETALKIVSPHGRIGLVLASGILTDDNNKSLFTLLVDEGRLVHGWDFENREGIFPGVDSRYKFCLLCATGPDGRRRTADFAFYMTAVSDLAHAIRHFSLSSQDLTLVNPVSRTCPTFRGQREAQLGRKIYQSTPAWARHTKTSTWPGNPKTPFNMSNDSSLFIQTSSIDRVQNSDTSLLPLYESKLIHQFNHRFATYAQDDGSDAASELSDLQLADATTVIRSRYSLPQALLRERFPGHWFLAYRKIARATDERTSIAAIIPEAPCGDSLIIIESLTASNALLLCGVINSFVYDYCARQKVAGTNFNHWIWHQLPLPTEAQLSTQPTWDLGTHIPLWSLPRLLELTYTGWDLAPFASEAGYDGAPFHWDLERRFLLRAELDAAFFHLYGLSRDDTDYVMDAFPIAKRNDEKVYGEYRTKRAILEIYDAMSEAARTDKPYRTRLDPPPAHPRVAHAPRTEGRNVGTAKGGRTSR